MAALVLAFASGGYFLTSWGAVSIALLALFAAVVVVTRGSLGGRWGIVALAGWGGLAAWQGLSSLWADQPSAAILAMNQTILYSAAFGLVLVGVRRTTQLTHLLGAALVGAAAVGGVALAARLVPSLGLGPDEGRLAFPLSYWNGLGAILAFGAVIAVGIVARPATPVWLRAVAGALVPMLLLGLLFTFSRGALAALVLGVIVLVAIAPGRLETVAALLGSVAVSTPLLLLANNEDELSVLSGPLPTHGESGLRVLLVLLATMLVAGVVVILLGAAVARIPAQRRRPVGLALGSVAVLAVALAVAVNPPQGGPVDWGRRQFDSFRSFDPGARAGAETLSDRLAVAAGSGRWQNWAVAADQFRSSPIAGTGAGDYRFEWEERRDIDQSVRNAHSLYLEVLAESGVIGLALLLLPAAAIVGAAVPVLRFGADAVTWDVAVALAAAAVVAVHMAGDWDWQLPTIVLPAIALGAGALKASSLARGEASVRAGASAWRLGLAALAIPAILLVAGPTIAADRVDEARDRAVRGDLRGALALARSAASIDAQDPTPRLLEANLLTDLGRPVEADAAFREAMLRSPRDWTIPADWAASLLRRGDLRAARIAAIRARRLNPREIRTTYLLEAARRS